MGSPKTENIEDSESECEDDRKKKEHTRVDFNLLPYQEAQLYEKYVTNYNHVASEMHSLNSDEKQVLFD